MARRLQQISYGLILTLLVLLPLLAQQGAKNGQWRSYASENGSTGYSPIDQINRDNVRNLQIAWSWKFDNFGSSNTEVTPIMVDGILYFPLSPRRTIIAADAGTGETLWTRRPPGDNREDNAARKYARGEG
jgi:quinoprotein glucose dehydrogenase